MKCKKCSVDKEKTVDGKCNCPSHPTLINCTCGLVVDVKNLRHHYLYDHFKLIW